jgi:hypothetical protein
MLNGPSFQTPVQREIADAVSTSGMISAGIESRMENTGGPIAHEVSAILGSVAKARQIPIYMGHEPGGNYLERAHMLPGHAPSPMMERLSSSPSAIRYTSKEGIGMAPADLSMLANSYSNPTQPLNSNMFDYKPGGCSGGYCGQG